jgi:hypothetical protein
MTLAHNPPEIQALLESYSPLSLTRIHNSWLLPHRISPLKLLTTFQNFLSFCLQDPSEFWLHLRLIWLHLRLHLRLISLPPKSETHSFLDSHIATFQIHSVQETIFHGLSCNPSRIRILVPPFLRDLLHSWISKYYSRRLNPKTPYHKTLPLGESKNAR